MSKRVVSQMRLVPAPKGEFLNCHLTFQKHPPIEFEMDVKAAMTVMLALKHFQRKHSWPIPMLRFSTSPKP
jgi:hypothetical protein